MYNSWVSTSIPESSPEPGRNTGIMRREASGTREREDIDGVEGVGEQIRVRVSGGRGVGTLVNNKGSSLIVRGMARLASHGFILCTDRLGTNECGDERDAAGRRRSIYQKRKEEMKGGLNSGDESRGFSAG